MTNSLPDSRMTMWLPDPLSDEVKASLQRLSNSDDVQHVAVMPDVHLAGDVCNGTVIATKELVYPVAVGADIGCGMLAVRVELEADALSNELSACRIFSGLYDRIPSLKHARSN